MKLFLFTLTILSAAIVGVLVFKNGSLEETSFLVHQDRKENPAHQVTLRNINSPLNDKSACDIAKKSCNSSACLGVYKKDELIKINPSIQYISPEVFGDFNIAVELKPVCGSTMAYIDEASKEIVCFCSYE